MAKLEPAATKNIGVIMAGLRLQAKEVTKERKRRRNSKESFTKMNENEKMKDNIGSKMVQANPKIVEKSVKKGRSRKAETGTDEGDEKNNLTRTWSRDPMLTWSSPISKLLALEQAITHELVKLIFSCCWSWLDLLSSPRRHEFLILDHGERCFLIDKRLLGLTR